MKKDLCYRNRSHYWVKTDEPVEGVYIYRCQKCRGMQFISRTKIEDLPRFGNQFARKKTSTL